MKVSKLFNNTLLMLIILASLSTSYLVCRLVEKPYLSISKQDSSYNINSTFWTYLNLGQKRLISSLLWVATILDADVEHYKKRDLNSWIFLRFSTISMLEPLFRETYSFGAPYLSIAKDDLSGASYLYERGLKFYPDDYTILYNASFHYYFESHEYDKAEATLEKLVKHPKTPTFAFTSLARIKANQTNLKDAFIFLSEYLTKQSPDSFIYKKIEEYLYSLKAEIDLQCLNAKEINCSKVDYDGRPYLELNGHYQAAKKFVPFTIKKKQK